MISDYTKNVEKRDGIWPRCQAVYGAGEVGIVAMGGREEWDNLFECNGIEYKENLEKRSKKDQERG